MQSLELWGGYECTVNRVGDEWSDQTIRSGHEERLGDLQLIADLGMRSVRYPALWERISPDRPKQRDFRWTDERLAEIQRLGINPILTLCHHGSGPHYTSLLDEGFAEGLACHAAAVAQRYPWVRDWTPVNEPLTTARFSALYGFWYPHTKDEGAFWTALLNEIDATRLAMREIRKVNPVARLIQTDDLGYCHATEPLQAEADFQNERRWMGWDLLFGRVVDGHPLYARVASFGLADRLQRIADDPCPPDVIGINHYLSSERLMDHRVELYPHRSLADRKVAKTAGLLKVDVDAIRHREEGVIGLEALLQQAWDRYGQTVAVTECHHGGTREDQVRWFVECWEAAERLRAGGVDICAVTAWSLLGSYDWNRMVTCQAGHYETGVYDVRTGTPRPTLLATVLKDLAAGHKPAVPGISGPGWWRKEARLIHREQPLDGNCELDFVSEDLAAKQPLLIVGQAGDLAALAVRACEMRSIPYVRCTEERTSIALARVMPWAVLDASDRDRVCNVREAVARAKPLPPIANQCAESGVPYAVITGAQPWHQVNHPPRVLELRTQSVFVPWDQWARACQMLELLERGKPLDVDAAEQWAAVYGPDLMDVALDLLFDGATGAFDLRNRTGLSELALARELAMVAGTPEELLRIYGDAAEQPAFSWPAKQSYLPPLPTMLERFVREWRCDCAAPRWTSKPIDQDALVQPAE
jgi:dTDP-4-dehydrorhamnose reductase